MHFKTKAIILDLHLTDKKESYITTYTQNYGKVVFLTRGLGKNEAKLKTALLPFSLSEIIAVTSRKTPVITRASLIKSLYSKSNFKNQSLAFYLSGLINDLTEEGLRDKQIFSLILGTLNVLSRSKTDKNLRDLILIYFPLKLLKYLGQLPELGNCAQCSERLKANSCFLNYKSGGLICSNCHSNNNKSIKLTPREFYFLRKIPETNFKTLIRYNNYLSSKSLEKLALTVNLYALYLTGLKIHPFKTTQIINNLSPSCLL